MFYVSKSSRLRRNHHQKYRSPFEQILLLRGARWYQLRLGGYPPGGVGVVGFDEGVGVAVFNSAIGR